MNKMASDVLEIAKDIMSSDWGRALKDDFVEPEAMKGSDLRKVNSVKLVKNPKRRTWWMVYDRKGDFIGQVRTTGGGYQEYILGASNERRHGGMYQTAKDPDHAYAILTLLKEIGG